MRRSIKPILIKISYSLLFLFLLLYCLVFNNQTGWMLFFFSCLLFLSSIITLFPSLKKVNLVIEKPIQGHVSETIELPIEIYRMIPSLIPIPRLVLTFPKTITNKPHYLFFYFGNSQTISYTWQPQKRGLYQEFPVTLESRDLFSFFSKKKQKKIMQSVLILPEKKENILSVLPLLTPYFNQQNFGDPTFTVRNYRQYQRGDSLKNIDWKLSSKKQDLIYKVLETESFYRLTFIFLGQSSPFFEECLSFYYSLQEEVQKMQSLQQFIFGENIPDAATFDQTAFAKIQPTQKQIQLPSLNGCKIFLFVPEKTRELTQQIEPLKKRNQVYLYDCQELNQLADAAKKEVFVDGKTL